MEMDNLLGIAHTFVLFLAVDYGNWFDAVQEYWNESKTNRNILVLFYEDMLEVGVFLMSHDFNEKKSCFPLAMLKFRLGVKTDM